MNNNSILLINPDFDPSLSEKLSLTVKIGNDTFSYAITDDEQQLLYAVYDEQECEDGKQKFLERIKADGYLKLNYKKVKVAVTANNFICIPNALFTHDFAADQSAFLENTEGSKFFTQEQNDEFTTVFSLSEQMANAITQTWSDNKILFENTGLLQLISKVEPDTLVVDFTAKSFTLIHQRGKQIVFQKDFQFDDLDEFTYYLLLTAKQLDIDSESTQVKLCGIINEGDEKFYRIKEYFSEVSFLPVASNLDVSIIDDMPAHYYTNLLALQECE